MKDQILFAKQLANEIHEKRMQNMFRLTGGFSGLQFEDPEELDEFAPVEERRRLIK